MCRRDCESLKADLSKGQLEPSANRHGSIFPPFESDFNCFSADGKWGVIVPPIQIAIIRERVVGLTT